MKRIPWPAPITPAVCKIEEDTVHSTTFNDLYFSRSGGLAEKRYVFVEANHLEERFRRSRKVTVLEFGFGLGLNLLSTMDAHTSASNDCVLDYVAFEKHPLTKDQLRECFSEVIGTHAHAESMITNLPPLLSGFHRIVLSPKVILTLIYGDAASSIKELDASVDVFYLDGFSPRKNEDLWTSQLFTSFRRLAASGATFSTYSSAGDVRRRMSYAGFDVRVKKGFGQKKDMLVGTFHEETQAKRKSVDNVTIIGGGISGCSLALRASELGLNITLIDSESALLARGSSNPLPLVRPTISLDFGPRGQFNWYAYLYAMRFYRMWSRSQPLGWREIEVIQLAKTETEFSKMKDAIKTLNLGQDFLRCIDREFPALTTVGRKTSSGILISGVGQLDKCQTGFAQAIRNRSIELVTEMPFIDLADGGSVGRCLIKSDIDPVVLANPQTVQRLVSDVCFRLQPIRGQSTRVVGMEQPLKYGLCGDGYLAGLDDGSVWSSGTFDLNDESEKLLNQDDSLNVDRIRHLFGPKKSSSDYRVLESWAGVRYATHDRMPHVGRLAQSAYALTGFGSKGFTWAPLATEIIVSEILGLSCPIERSLKKRMNPLRFN